MLLLVCRITAAAAFTDFVGKEANFIEAEE